MNCKAVIFDLDGTLVDTIQDLAAAINFALASLGLPTHSVDACRQMVGDAVSNLVKRALPAGKQHLAEKTLALMKQRYKEIFLDHARLYDGIDQTVLRLRSNGIRLAVLTNKDQDIATRTIDHFFAPGLFEIVTGTTDSLPIKPGPAASKLLEAMKISPTEAILVGDSAVDIETADQANIRSVGAAWGFRGREALTKHNADIIIDQPDELLNLLA